MKTITKILSLIVAASCISVQSFAAVDEVDVVLSLNTGKKQVEKTKLKKTSDNTYRLQLAVHKMPNWWRIVSIDILHSEATANKGDDGYWVLADGRLGKFNHEKEGTLTSRRNPMPLFGFKKGDSAFVAIVKGLKYEFSAIIDYDKGVYKAFPRFHIKELYTQPYEDIIVDFTFFKGKDANYSSMGREYRKYQLERGEVKPLKERVIGNPTLAYTVESLFMKFCTAWYMRDSDLKTNRGDHWRVEDDPPLTKFCTFEEFKDVMHKIKALGVEKIDICLTNWNERANGRNPTCSIAEPELGGNAKLREVTALAKKLNIQLAPHILHTEHYTISSEFNKDDIALDHEGKYKGYAGMGGKGFNPCFKQVFKKYVIEHYDRMKTLGFTLMHIDVTSAIVPYNCFSIDHFCTREECAYYMNRVGMLSDAYFNVWSSECGMDQVANTLDYVLYVSGYPSFLGAKHHLMDTMVPIWQIVYHGIILSNPFRHTIDYNCHWQRSSARIKECRLKMVEFGGRPTYYWAMRKTSDFKVLKEAYDEYSKRSHLQYEFMNFHGEITPNVFITKYSDGSEIVSNYSKEAFAYKGQNVPAMDYIIYNAKK